MLVDATHECPGAGSIRDCILASVDNRLSENHSRGGAIASGVHRSLRSISDEISSNLLHRVRSINVASTSHAVLCHQRRHPEQATGDGDVSTVGSKCHLDRVSDEIYTSEDWLTDVLAITDVL